MEEPPQMDLDVLGLFWKRPPTPISYSQISTVGHYVQYYGMTLFKYTIRKHVTWWSEVYEQLVLLKLQNKYIPYLSGCKMGFLSL